MAGDTGGGGLRSGVLGREIAERRLRDVITQGKVAPGQRLVEAEISEQFGVTRNSARLALTALEADGLVERIPNRGARVRAIPVAEVIAIHECRVVLDGLLARKAAENAGDEDVERLQGNWQLMEQAVTDHELLKYADLIHDHHALVREVARHPVAAALVERLQAQIVRHQFPLSLRPGRAQQTLAELKQVVEAVAAHDPDAAEAAARRHQEGVIAALLAEPVDG